MIRGSNILYLLFFLFIACNKEETKPFIPQGNWTKGESSSLQPRDEPVTFTINDEIYLGLGYAYSAGSSHPVNQFMNFDVATGWYPNKYIPSFPGEGRCDAVAFTIDHKAYVGLGYKPFLTDDGALIKYYTDFWEYDSQKKTWSQLPYDFPGAPRRQAVAFSLNGKGYVGTGLSEEREILGDFYEFDPQTGWKHIANIDEKRYGATAFVANGKAYVCLGKAENGYINHMTRFIPETQTWKGILASVVTEEGPQCTDATAFVIRKNGTDYPYIAGGTKTDSYSQHKPLSDCWGFDPLTETWIKVAPLPYSVSKGIGFTKEGNGYITSTIPNGFVLTWKFAIKK